MPRPRPHSRQAGFTLLEMLAVLLLVVLLASLSLAAPKSPGSREAGDAAARMRAMLTGALAAAELDGGDVLVRADAAATANRNGRFLALAVPPGVTAAADPDAEWIEMEGGVMWGAGGAATDPMGAPTDGRVPGTVRCTAAACDTGAADYVVYFVGHARAPSAAWALVLTRSRDLQLFRWDGAGRAWSAA